MAEAVETLSNFVGGRWIPSTATELCRRAQSGARHRDRAHAAVDRTRRRRGRHRRDQRLSRLERDAAGRPRARDVPLQGAARGALRGAGPAGHDRARQDAGRVARQRAARHRVRRGGLRRAVAADGLRPRERRARHRLHGRCGSRSASAPRSRRSTFPAMVPLWFLPFAVACGNTFVLKPSEQVPLSQPRMFELLAAVRPAAGRRQPRERRPGGRRGDLRSPGHPGRVVRRLDAGRAARLPARHARRQARPGARRREELHRRDARRRPRSQRSRSSPSRSTAAPASAAWPAACSCRSARRTRRRATG